MIGTSAQHLRTIDNEIDESKVTISPLKSSKKSPGKKSLKRSPSQAIKSTSPSKLAAASVKVAWGSKDGEEVAESTSSLLAAQQAKQPGLSNGMEIISKKTTVSRQPRRATKRKIGPPRPKD